MAAAAATTLPYSVPANYAIRLVEEPLSAHSHIDDHPVQPRASDPSHFQFPRTSLHAVTLHSHFKGPHAPGSVRASPRTATTWVPPTDIRETLANYHIEMEVAGVTDKEDILIQWLTPHTLLVQGTASRPRNIGLVDQGEGKRVWEGKESEGWATETGRAKVFPPFSLSYPIHTDTGELEPVRVRIIAFALHASSYITQRSLISNTSSWHARSNPNPKTVDR
jgi:hypothetical protein